MIPLFRWIFEKERSIGLVMMLIYPRAVAKVLGLKADFQSIDWSMKETELKNGTIDCIDWNGYTATPSRQNELHFSRVYELSGQSLVVRKDSKIKNFADMKGKTRWEFKKAQLLKLIFDKYPQVLKKLVKGQKPNSFIKITQSAFMDLQAGRTQGVLAGTVYAGYYATHIANNNNYKLISASAYPADRACDWNEEGDSDTY